MAKVHHKDGRRRGHIIWDLKMDFTRCVLDGHKLPTPAGSTYAGVVSRESVRIALTYAALNGLEVCAADLQAPSLYGLHHLWP
jgi:hypothetical protein